MKGAVYVCTGCGETFTLQAVEGAAPPTADEWLDVALDFGCPYCGSDLQVRRGERPPGE